VIALRSRHSTFLEDADTTKSLQELVMAETDQAGMEIDSGPVATAGSSADAEKKKPRFEIKKYNAVALWAWGRCHTF
jgi:hypothetical protein